MSLFRLARLVVALISYHKRDYKARYRMKERELQNKFVEWLKQNKKETQHIYEEVDCIWGMTDVILYDGRKNNGYEIKLKNVKKVIEQALSNLS